VGEKKIGKIESKVVEEGSGENPDDDHEGID
jgi:hypothetical protein